MRMNIKSEVSLLHIKDENAKIIKNFCCFRCTITTTSIHIIRSWWSIEETWGGLALLLSINSSNMPQFINLLRFRIGWFLHQYYTTTFKLNLHFTAYHSFYYYACSKMRHFMRNTLTKPHICQTIIIIPAATARHEMQCAQKLHVRTRTYADIRMRKHNVYNCVVVLWRVRMCVWVFTLAVRIYM